MRTNLFSRCIIITVAALSAVTFACHAQGIQFEASTFDEALAKAKQENKLLFMDCYTTWCGPCRMLSKTVFPNDTAGVFFNKHFINLKMDMEKGEGTTLSRTFRVTGYPTLLFIDPADKEVVYRITGARPSVQWLVDEAQKAMDPNQNLKGLSARYQANKQDPETVLNYLNCLTAASLTYERDSILYQYLNAIPDAGRYSEINWAIMESQVSEPYSIGFDYLLKHAAGFRQTMGDEKVNEKIATVYRYAVARFTQRRRIPAEQFPQQRFDKLVSLLQAYDGANASFYRAQLNLVKLTQAGDYNGMLDALEETEKDPAITGNDRLYFIWINLNYLWECKDAALIDRGLVWAEKIKSELSTPPMKRGWLQLKAGLYAAKGDSEMEKKLKAEAEQMK